MTERFSPFVYWAQTDSNISIRIDLKDVKSPKIELSEQKLKFLAHGRGARGVHDYSFELNFYQHVSPDDSNYKITDRQIDFTIKKEKNGFWVRLIGSPQKPAWLKIDFDKWQSEDVDVEEDVRNVLEDYPSLYEQLQKEERGYRIEDYKKVYLVLYNMLQFVCFFFILLVIGVRYFKEGVDSMDKTYDNVGTVMKICQILMWLEVLHPIFGYTKNSMFPPLMQNLGRSIILFLMIECEPRMQTKPVVFYLFIVWSSAEVVRYMYYIGQLLRIEFGFLTWLRYTMWVPLYPLGILCEGVIILRNIPYFEETLRFTVSMPNTWNFAFHFPTAMRLHLLLLFFPAMYVMMTHMYKERNKKIGPKSWRKKK